MDSAIIQHIVSLKRAFRDWESMIEEKYGEDGAIDIMDAVIRYINEGKSSNLVDIDGPNGEVIKQGYTLYWKSRQFRVSHKTEYKAACEILDGPR